MHLYIKTYTNSQFKNMNSKNLSSFTLANFKKTNNLPLNISNHRFTKTVFLF